MASSHGIRRMEGIGERGIAGTLAGVLALTSDAVLAFDGTGRVLLANDEVEGLFGRDRGSVVGADVRTLFCPVADAARATSAEADDDSLPFPLDGTGATLVCSSHDGSAVPVEVRCEKVDAPGDTYLLVAHALDAASEAARERDRLVEQLSEANHRLSGTLKIVLDTLDSQDVGTLFSRVLQELADTMGAVGTVVYLAEADGFRMRGATRSLEGLRVPQFLPFGKGVATIATRAGHALRLRVAAPEGHDLRAGTLTSRQVVDEETHEVHRIPSRLLPPFVSFLCVPVWFGGHVIAIIEVGWAQLHPLRREDARLLDAVGQYLSVQLMGAFAAMRAQRNEQLDQLAERLHDKLASLDDPHTPEFAKELDVLCEGIGARAALVSVNPFQYAVVVVLPVGGSQSMPFDLDELEEGAVEDGVAVVPILAGSDLARWLQDLGEPSLGALVDCGVLAGKRRAFMVLRPADAEPLEEIELSFLHRVADDVRSVVVGEEVRSQDKRISQALQRGMRNELQEVEGITARGIYSSATATAFVGGDFYDLIRLPERRACVIMGDVSGKGVEAASVSAAVKTALGAYAWVGLPPAHMVRSLNDFLMGFSRLETFATLFVGVVDLARGRLVYCSAGHPPAILMRADRRELETLDVQSGVVGAFHDMPYHDGDVSLREGDALLLYTDGVTEARDPSGAFFGEDGLRDAVMREGAGGFDGILDRLLAVLDSFTARNLEDDVAMVAIRFDRLGPGPEGDGAPAGLPAGGRG